MTGSPHSPPRFDPAEAYVGLTVEAAKEKARQDDRPLRVLAPGAMFTMEYIENRINVTVVDGVVVRARSG